MELNIIKTDDVEWTIEAMPENDGPEGSSASGDDDLDKADWAEIRKEMEWNEWAWCVAKVTGTWNGLEATAYLGGCSYATKHDFEIDDYCADIQSEVLAELNEKARKIATAIASC